MWRFAYSIQLALTHNRMLFEFHRQQNVKKPGTVHATYLIAGTKRNLDPASTSSNQLEGVEEPVQSSPFRSSPIPNIEEAIEDSPVLSITLVREENLEGAFQDI
jgi:DNA polymerase delta subunit 3